MKHVYSLTVSIALCVVWTFWKSIGIYTFRVPMSWDYIVSSGNAMLIAYATVWYIPWLVWSLMLLDRYEGELHRRGLLIGSALALVFDVFLFMVKGVPSMYTLVLTAITFSLYGGVVEEVLYRGVLFDALRARVKVLQAVVVQAVLFALSHPWSLGAMLAALVLGLITGFMRLKHGLGACIALHYMLNLATHT